VSCVWYHVLPWKVVTIVCSVLRFSVSHVFWLVLYEVIILSHQYVCHLMLQFSAYMGVHGVGCIFYATGQPDTKWHCVVRTVVVHTCRDVNNGWLLRTPRANGASLFFVCIYLHTGRNIYYGSCNFIHTWSVGVVILLLSRTSFIGYVLPWGQISVLGAKKKG
jgi:hypothetical protein